jgi:hypothetical protein
MMAPSSGQAAFFHYKNEDDILDAGWTKHSGCPVLEGTKWIGVQWLRQGVRPWVDDHDHDVDYDEESDDAPRARNGQRIVLRRC